MQQHTSIRSVPRILSIAGTDPIGGAGASADLKSIAAAGGFGLSVVTALVAQNTRGVRAVHSPPLEFVRTQLQAVFDDLTPDAVKTGMLGSPELIGLVRDWLAEHPVPLLLVDPVMVAASGDRLLDPQAERAMREFAATAQVVTPNIPELGVLTGRSPARSVETAVDQARGFVRETGAAVIVKTGHLTGPQAGNLWVGADGAVVHAPAARVDTRATHGTGCSLASALVTRLAAGHDPQAALAWTTRWLHEAIRHGDALEIGPDDAGHGPVDHGRRGRRLQAAAASEPWFDTAVPEALHVPEDLPTAGLPAPEAEVPAPLRPAGPWTGALMGAAEQTVQQMLAGDFLSQLGDGTLEESAFRAYMAQDARYLPSYARALAGLGARSQELPEVARWSHAATVCLDAELSLHREWGAAEHLPVASPVTAAYTCSLLAHVLADPLVVGAAAVLPCFWLYGLAGWHLASPAPDHPYASWLAMYEGEDFLDGTQEAVAAVERLFAGASPTERAAAARAFLDSCRHEVEFFDQALRLQG